MYEVIVINILAQVEICITKKSVAPELTLAENLKILKKL